MMTTTTLKVRIVDARKLKIIMDDDDDAYGVTIQVSEYDDYDDDVDNLDSDCHGDSDGDGDPTGLRYGAFHSVMLMVFMYTSQKSITPKHCSGSRCISTCSC